ncbi:hypothetical protein [Schleiferilactobacillus perolens]|uniref:hypothetical protein n=1 Tax=Schleiferilactobacillus perolens TaxID=100468 RepID=UPI0023576ED1|nr:hypothetical protein [Schleiferilactobacillus perolens]MCI2172278.1 hypothetical protein [Schleiferilactobacillus perolens]
MADIVAAYQASVALKTPGVGTDGKPFWTAASGISKYLGIDVASIQKGTYPAGSGLSSLPPDTATHYWNGVAWTTSPTGFLGVKNENRDSASVWLGYGQTVGQYATELESWLQQLTDQMKVPQNQSAVMNYTAYRAGDLSQGNSFWDWLSGLGGVTGKLWNSIILGNGLSDSVPTVFQYNATSGASKEIAGYATTTVQGLDRMIDIVMGVIQNSIIHQALNDVRSLGNATDETSYAPATLQGALGLNKVLSNIATLFGLSPAVNTSVATQAYQAISTGIVDAVVRNFKYGMTTALSGLNVVPTAASAAADAAAAKAAGETVYSAATLKSTPGYTDGTALGVANTDQSSVAQLSQAAGYAWVTQVGQAVIKMAANDAATHSKKTTIDQIASALQTSGALTPTQYTNLMTGGSANGDANGYTRNGSAAASVGAQNFILKLYNAEANAVSNALSDYVKDPGLTAATDSTTNTTTTTTLLAGVANSQNQFVNPGDPSSTPTVYSMTDYSAIYKYLLSYNATYKGMVAADTASHTALNGNIPHITTAPVLSSSADTLTGTLTGTAGQSLLQAESLADTAYINAYNAEADKANAAFNAGVAAAKGALLIQTQDCSTSHL